MFLLRTLAVRGHGVACMRVAPVTILAIITATTHYGRYYGRGAVYGRAGGVYVRRGGFYGGRGFARGGYGVGRRYAGRVGGLRRR
jgi:hypothetical protein